MASDKQQEKPLVVKDIGPTAEAALDDRPTEHGIETYLPEPRATRHGIALCLSGGGFRAALFHLGALRRLNELGLLSQVTDISSVSGGSVISGHLARRIQPWPEPGQVLDGWDEKVAKPFYDFAGRNIRTPAILMRLRHPLTPSAPIMKLADTYERKLTAMRIPHLPERPNFIFCATDMVFGVNWTFQRGSAGDYLAGYLNPAPDWPLAWAIASSSCFPPVFDPFPLSLRPEQLKRGSASPGEERSLVSKIHLTDGGVYDNMGLEPVWKQAKTVLVSDGGARFTYEWEKTWLGRVLRYQSIQGNQSSALRKRWLMSNFMTAKTGSGSGFSLEGAYWGISSATAHYTSHEGDRPPRGYSEKVVRERIAPIRTDFDAFTRAEIAVLENHGYLLADAAINRHLAHLIAVKADLKPPHAGDYMSDAWVDRNLTDTGRRLLGRPFPRIPLVNL